MLGSFGQSHEHLGSPLLVSKLEELAILSSTNGTRNDLLLSFQKPGGFFASHRSRPEPTQIKFVVLVLGVRPRPPGGLEPPEPKVRQLGGSFSPSPLYDGASG